MRTIERRLRQLEDRFGTADNQRRILVVVRPAGSEDHDRYIEILRECGYLPTGPMGVVNFCSMPKGMNAEETERFLRERGAEICGP